MTANQISAPSLKSDVCTTSPCTHDAIIPGLDCPYCPDCKSAFSSRTKEYKSVLEQPQPEKFRVHPKPETPKTRTLNLDELIRAAYHLDHPDLLKLMSAIQGLLEALESEEFRVQQEATMLKTRTLNEQHGSFELKLINNCGPYLYLRWWSGGKHRSTYIGKAKSNGTD